MDSSPPATRQPKQARAMRTRERILDRAEQVFATKGYEAASLTSDILEPAGISVGSFYHQFSDKRAVLYALLDERPTWRDASLGAIAVAAAQPTLTEAVRHGMLRYLDDIDAHPASWWIHCREVVSADPEIRSVVTRSWGAVLDSLRTILARSDDQMATSPGRLHFATCGLSGVLRTYLVGDAETRRHLRDDLLPDCVAGCVASLAD